ncbi:MAG: hypothetical protein HY308_10545 [Gammaproteobacteria bacterium]|nr:hypothetical protein [Gammaproteobacteria bacterium]
MVFINDPLTRENYVLNTRERIAYRVRLPQVIRLRDSADAEDGAGVAPLPGEEAEILVHKMPKPQTTSLGTRVLAGVKAEGSRSTVTIPAGEIGNARPIVIEWGAGTRPNYKRW